MPELSLEEKLKKMEKERAEIKNKYPTKPPKKQKNKKMQEDFVNVADIKKMSSQRKVYKGPIKKPKNVITAPEKAINVSKELKSAKLKRKKAPKKIKSQEEQDMEN